MTRAAYPARRVGAGDSRAGYAPAIVPEFLRGDAQPACTPVTAEFFFGADTKASSTDVRAAARICRHCPLRAACLQWAIDNDEKHGVWGGLTHMQRSLVRDGRRDGDRLNGPKKRRLITCSDCGELRTHDGKGRCASCNKRRRKKAAA